jgi:hypothetical protein
MNLSHNFIIFSKSLWDETPRLRHQVANLLLSYEHRVVFFEKPDFIFSRKNKLSIKKSKLIDVKRSRQLIHHQLRVSCLLSNLNAKYEKKSITDKVNVIDSEIPIVINFNYDYYFLRDIFPFSKIITIINDDFVAQSKFNNGKHVVRALEATCRISDAVLTVSFPLAQQVKNWCDPQIFLPWAPSRHIAPNMVSIRSSILIWAHIDGRMDFELLKSFAIMRPKIQIDLIGPISSKIKKIFFDLVRQFPNINYLGTASLDNINFDMYFCTAIPYLNHIPDINAITASNKTFQLLSKGLPIVTHGMPNFYESAVIVKTNCLNEFIDGIDLCFDEFFNLQNTIANLVNQNLPKDRYRQIMSYLNS